MYKVVGWRDVKFRGKDGEDVSGLTMYLTYRSSMSLCLEMRLTSGLVSPVKCNQLRDYEGCRTTPHS